MAVAYSFHQLQGYCDKGSQICEAAMKFITFLENILQTIPLSCKVGFYARIIHQHWLSCILKASQIL